MARRGIGRTLCFSALTLALFVAFLGIATEVAFRLSPHRKGEIHDIPWVQKDGYWLYPPNWERVIENEAGQQVRFRTNEWGLRSTAEAAPGARLGTLLLLGDSFVEGLNTLDGGTLCRQLEGRAILAGARCLNAGIAGFSNYQSYRLLEDHFEVFLPDAVILVVYLGNDLRDNYFSVPSQRSRALPSATPSTWKRFAASRSFLAVKDFLLTHSAAIPRVLAFRSTVDPDRFANYFLSETLSYENEMPAEVEEAVAKSSDTLRWFGEFLSDKAVPFWVIAVPSKAQVYEDLEMVYHYETRPEHAEVVRSMTGRRDAYSFDNPSIYFQRICAGLDIPFRSLLGTFREKQGLPLFYEVDLHWTSIGQRVAASAIATYLQSEAAQSDRRPR